MMLKFDVTTTVYRNILIKTSQLCTTKVKSEQSRSIVIYEVIMTALFIKKQSTCQHESLLPMSLENLSSNY